jgi:rhodanese-related sulfurtransferase
MPGTISREELRSAIDDDTVTVVVALPAAQFARRHLRGAVYVVAEDPDERVRAVLPDRSVSIVTYSTDHACMRGPELAERLERLGYQDVRNYEDGIEDWIAAGYSVERQ